MTIVKKENYLVKYSPNKLKNFRKIDSIKKAVESESVSLSVLKKQTSEKSVMEYIILWIDRLNEFLNINRKMTFEQMERTAEYILQDYYYLKQADIYLIFSEAEKGRYGEFYECLDGSKILGWFDKYDCERANIVYDEYLRIHEQQKEKRGWNKINIENSKK